MQLVDIIFSGVANAVSLNFFFPTDIASEPCAFLGFSDLDMLRIFSSETRKPLIKEGFEKLGRITFHALIAFHWRRK